MIVIFYCLLKTLYQNPTFVFFFKNRITLRRLSERLWETLGFLTIYVICVYLTLLMSAYLFLMSVNQSSNQSKKINRTFCYHILYNFFIKFKTFSKSEYNLVLIHFRGFLNRRSSFDAILNKWPLPSLLVMISLSHKSLILCTNLITLSPYLIINGCFRFDLEP